MVRAPVQTDRTEESMVEIVKELRGIIGERPPTEEEFVKIRENRILRLPGSWETVSEVGDSIEDLIRSVFLMISTRPIHGNYEISGWRKFRWLHAV